MADTDRTLPIIAISPALVTGREGDSGTTPFAFTVTRSGDVSQASTVDWTVSSFTWYWDIDVLVFDSTQPNAEDFGGTMPSGTITFAPGETTKTLTVNVRGDTKAERTEEFMVTLANPVGGTLAEKTVSVQSNSQTGGNGQIPIGERVTGQPLPNSAVGSIVDDDTPISFSFFDLHSGTIGAREGDDGTQTINFGVTRTDANMDAFSFDWSVAGYVPNGADAADFGGALPSGTLHFAEGELTKVISVTVTGDRVGESDEYFVVTLSNLVTTSPHGVVLTTKAKLGFIKNDDVIDPGVRLAVMSNGVGREFRMDAYSGPVGWLKNMHIAGHESEAMKGSDAADFINAQGGDDAVDGGMGDDVLDGGTGSNWLVGGVGSDTFFIDGRGGSTTWSTVTDLEKGEWVTAWGWTEGVSKLTWAEMSGADGNKGATAHIDLDANGSIDMSLTFAGKSSGAILVTPGQVNGSSYLAFTLA